MKIISLIVVISLLSFSMAFGTENKKYLKKMTQIIKQYKEAKTVEDFKKVANQFEVVGNVEKAEWLPWYYQANSYIIMIYMDKDADQSQKDKYLDVAQKTIEKIEKQFPEESEIQVLKAFYLISRLGVDPIKRGAEYIGYYTDAVYKAYKFNSKNPRAIYMKLSSDIGGAEYMGKDVSLYCPDLKKLIENWKTYRPISEIHPDWGKDEAIKLLNKSCK